MVCYYYSVGRSKCATVYIAAQLNQDGKPEAKKLYQSGLVASLDVTSSLVQVTSKNCLTISHRPSDALRQFEHPS